ncbi:hypothetical protein [Paraburkholderia sp. BL23I1N1]|uniref:hypothetical protein n=1 Tax=Paraburkholderia sp. BL23I1N1 TaxID=1938802 RepID=UPI0011C36E93|nr:hypothetical protein [Paraburkholderia sp. BL23I1N1]
MSRIVKIDNGVVDISLENEHWQSRHASCCYGNTPIRMLAGEGKSIEYIAALFRISPLVVRRRLKLANVSPKLLELFRNDEMKIEQVTALALGVRAADRI